ncbi:MAG: beta-galactosidase [Candidatus Firestonebacteria bacterium]
MGNKIKVVSVVVLFVLLVLGIVYAQENEIKIPNGGFEAEQWDYDKNLPTKGWEINQKTLFEVIERDTKIKKEGESSLHIKDTDTGAKNDAIFWQLSGGGLKPYLGKTVCLTGWIKQVFSKPAKCVHIAVVIMQSNSKWTVKTSGPETEGEDDWTQYSVVTRIPEDTVLFRVVVYCATGFGSTGDAYFDDLKLTILDDAKIDGRKEGVVADSSAKNEAISGSRFIIFDDFLRVNWKRVGFGGPIVEESDLSSYSGEKGIRVKLPDTAPAFCGFYLSVDTKNRIPDMSQFCDSNGWLEFVLKPEQKLQVGLSNKDVLMALVPIQKYLVPLDNGWSKVKIPLNILTKGKQLNNFNKITFQFTEKPTTNQVELDEIVLVSDKVLPEPTMQLDATLKKQIDDIIGKEVVYTKDNFIRPEIKNGTFYIRGVPHFFIGPFHINSNADFRGAVTKREGYGDAKYDNELLTDITAKEIGFSSLQLSGASPVPVALQYDLPGLTPNILDGILFYPNFLKGLNGMPFVLDFAWIPWHPGTPEKVIKVMIEEGKISSDILQQNSSWHDFIPLCPEHPKGMEIYKTYWRSGTSITLNNGGNPFIHELFNESQYNCSCPYNRENFAKLMEVRYKTIDKANEIWNTNFSSFEDASKVEKFVKYPGLWVDWAKFMGDRYVEILKTGISTIRDIDKRQNVYFTEQPSMYNFITDRGATLDYRKIADLLDVICVEGGVQFGHFEPKKDSSEGELVLNQGQFKAMLYLDMATALAKGKPVINNEMYCARYDGKLRIPTKREDFTTSLWNEVVHGSSASYFYNWDKRSYEWKTFEEAKKNVLYGGYKAYSLLNPYAYPPESHKGLKDFEKEMEKLGPIVLPFPRIKGTVALFFSYPTLRMSAAIQMNTGKIITDYYTSLMFSHYPIEVLYEEDLSKVDLDKYQAIVIPFIDNSYLDTMDVLKKYVQKGGIIFCSAGAFDSDEYGKLINYNELLGFKKEKINSEDDKVIVAAERSSAKESVEIPIKINYEIAPTAAEVLLRTKKGKNFLLENEIGKGKVYYMSVDLEISGISAILPYVLKDVRKYGEIVDENNKSVSNVEFQLIDRGDTKLLYLVNWEDNKSKFALLKLYQTHGKSFYICDPIKEEVYVCSSEKKEWTKEDVAKGMSVFLPSQVRVVLLVQLEEPKGYKEVAMNELKSRFDKLVKAELGELEESNKRQIEIDIKSVQARKYEGVKAENCFFVDIAKYVNMGFKDEIDGDKQGGWFDHGANDLRNMAIGRQILAQVPFEIINPDKNNGKSVIILAGGPSRLYFPDKVTDINVNRKANNFYFLHTIGWGASGTLFTYVVHYENGDIVEISIDNDIEVSGWWNPKEIPNAKIAYETSNLVAKSVGLYCYRWKNPKPDIKIKSIDIISSKKDAVPSIIAITGEF